MLMYCCQMSNFGSKFCSSGFAASLELPHRVTASARVVGSKAKSKTVSGKGKVKVSLKGKVKKNAKVEVTYAVGKAKGKTVVPLGKAVKVSTK